MGNGSTEQSRYPWFTAFILSLATVTSRFPWQQHQDILSNQDPTMIWNRLATISARDYALAQSSFVLAASGMSASALDWYGFQCEQRKS